jgi:ATP-dependent Clp protease adaptor protein ClpS
VSTPDQPADPSGGTATMSRPTEAGLVNWVTLVWDDPVNLMSYVTHVFSTYFGYPVEKATELMLQVHNQGKAVVSAGTREQMEIDVDAMHGYGLWATMEPG